MNIRYTALLVCLMPAFWMCNNTPEPVKETVQAQQPSMFFSTRKAETEMRSETSWCNLPFEEAVLINAESTNMNRRYFALGDGVYKIVVRRGTTAAPFMVRRKGTSLELITSDNFPICLARRNYFSLVDEGRTLLYLNPPYYEFRMESEPWQNALKVTIEFPPGSDNGLTVHRQKTLIDG